MLSKLAKNLTLILSGGILDNIYLFPHVAKYRKENILSNFQTFKFKDIFIHFFGQIDPPPQQELGLDEVGKNKFLIFITLNKYSVGHNVIISCLSQTVTPLYPFIV